MSEMQACLDTLTGRERDVLIYAGKGLSVKEIGAAMKVSQFTISDHLKRIYLKLRVSTRVEAAVIAAKCGLL